MTATPRSRHPIPWALSIHVAVALGATCLWLLGQFSGVETVAMMRDPAATAGVHPLTGAFSYAAVLAWFATGVIAGFGALALHELRRGGSSHRDGRGFLFATMALALILTFDDLFQFHENLAGEWFGLSDRLVIGAYLVAGIVYVVAYRRRLVSDRPWLLALAAFWMVVMLAIDEVLAGAFGPHQGVRIALEDGAKLMAAVLLCAYVSGQTRILIAAGFCRVWEEPAAA